MKNLFMKFALCAMLVVTVLGCKKDEDAPIVVPDNIRYLIASEGQFKASTASLTAVMKSGAFANDIFAKVNKRPLGDIAQSILQVGDNIYVAVNNSNKIEVFNKSSFKSVETILLEDSPNYMEYLGGDSIAVSTKTQTLIVDINHAKADRKKVRSSIGVVTAQLKVVGNKLFMATGPLRVATLGALTTDGVRKVTTADGGFVNSLYNSKILTDNSGKIWVLTATSLVCVDPVTEKVVKELPVGQVKIDQYGGRIDISSDGKTLFFTGKVNNVLGILSSPVSATVAPTALLFPLKDVRTLYNMVVSPEGTIIVCDVKFGVLERSLIREYTKTGEQISVGEAGIFSNYIHFMKK